MVRLLIAMKLAQLRHAPHGPWPWVGIVALVLAAASAVSTFLLGFVRYPDPSSSATILALVFAAWVAGRVAFETFAGGDVTLRPEFFRLLPLPPGRLALALLVVGLLDPALIFLALAFSSLIVLGARHGVVDTLLAVVGVVALLGFTSVLGIVIAGAVAAPGRRRRGLGTLLLALVISLVALAGPLLPSLIGAVSAGHVPVLSEVVRWLPSGWAPDAVQLGLSGRPAAVLPVAALAGLAAALAGIYPRVLRHRLVASPPSARRGRRPRVRKRLLPATPVGAVVGKELRLWARDPLRTTTLLIAVLVGLGSCTIPYLAHGTALLLPFAGLLTILIAGAVACNLIGEDGRSLELTILTPHSAPADLRGRQLAWLLVTGPYAVVLTLLLTWWSHQGWAWPWVLAGLPALLGGAAGVVPLASVTKVQPLDERGGLTAGWPLKVYLCLVLIALTALPAAAALTLATFLHQSWLSWSGISLGVLTGLLCAIVLPRWAARLLARRSVDILQVLTAAANPT